ncbi:ABC transporter permease subunit [Bartonella sp. DGB2]|uniref:ABC transporter permease subunit n=1 Tax=Bartonella sp. DGB2 TaxID=3388426 RepID=UPI0039900B1B
MEAKTLVEVNYNAAGVDVKGRSFFQDAWRRFSYNKASVISIYILIGVIFFALIVPILSPFSFDETDFGLIAVAPSWSNAHYFGTDLTGRDLLVRVAQGGRVSLAIGLAGALCITFIGLAYGALAGYLGGVYDAIAMRIIEILESLPGLIMMIVMVSILGRSTFVLFLAIALTSWTSTARMVRGLTFSLKQKAFIEAARTVGVSKIGIVLRHIVPNVLGLVMVKASFLVPSVILAESSLSYIGLGVQEPFSSWGGLISDGGQMIEGAPWVLFFPSLFLTITLFCFVFIGDGLRDALDPKEY